MVEVPEKIWPLGSYAPGNYTCRCLDCGEQFIGDKRAITCLECAVTAAKSQIAELRAEVIALQDESAKRGNMYIERNQTAIQLAHALEASEARVAQLSETLEKSRKNVAAVMKALMETGSRENLLLADAVHKADDVAREALFLDTRIKR